ncbi:hypothetical protein [Massilia sp. TSP1-1-2]|uniref:hypothetical protein n=1 Tax=unclassified Massilia TaxID=2609279 RepID=UPI003CED13FA
MNRMQERLEVSVPAPLRDIFAEWAETCDPGALCQGGADPHASARLYRALSRSSSRTVLARQALARIYADALVNMEFGQFAELRREGAQVFPWIAQVIASDPVLRAQLD